MSIALFVFEIFNEQYFWAALCIVPIIFSLVAIRIEGVKYEENFKIFFFKNKK